MLTTKIALLPSVVAVEVKMKTVFCYCADILRLLRLIKLNSYSKAIASVHSWSSLFSSH